MKNILHVVHICFTLPFFFGDQFLYFKGKGYGINVACSPSKDLEPYSKKMGFDYIETPIDRSINFKDDIRSILNICKYIRERNIDIVVGHTPKGALLAMIAGWLKSVPTRIYFRHGIVYETSRGFMRFVLKSADRVTSLLATKIVCVSDSVLKVSVADRLAPAKKQIVLGKGSCGGIDAIRKFNKLNINPEKQSALKQRLGIRNGEYVIGFCGRLVNDKGIVDLVQAFDLMNLDNCKLLFVGMFEERDALPEKVRQRILHDEKIIYTGYVKDDIEYYYSLMNVFVLPSYREGFPISILEALAMGLPVVTCNVTGCCDAVIDGYTGLFATHDPIDIKNKIEAIRYDHNHDCAGFGENGRKWVLENFDNRIVWKEIEKLYE